MDLHHMSRLGFRRSASAAVILLFILSACYTESPANDPNDDAGQRLVEVDPAHQQCEQAEDCVHIYVDCSGCGCGVPVNAKFEEQYQARYESLCSSYRGPVCEVYCPPVELTCISSRCVSEPAE